MIASILVSASERGQRNETGRVGLRCGDGRKLRSSQPGVPRGLSHLSMPHYARGTERERFDAKWTPEPNTGCWLWTASLTTTGYGMFHHHPFGRMAHRAAWRIYRGPIPDGMLIDHMCRVPICVNPDHLRVVTPQINTIQNSVSVAAKRAAQTVCSRCGLPFGVRKPRGGGKRGTVRRCLPCVRLRAREWHKKNKDRVNAKLRERAAIRRRGPIP